MPLNIIRNDISKVSADAIVNTANPMVAIGAGVDRAIYEAAGAAQLLEERAKIGPMKPGQAAFTPAFALDAKYIIHTVGPAWIDGTCGEREAVASCYRESLRIADDLDCESIAFPLISTGTYGFPKDEALKIAISEISSFLFTHEMTVYMVVYDRKSFVISGKAFSEIQSFIGDEDVVVHDHTSERERQRWRAAAKMHRKEDTEFLPDETDWLSGEIEDMAVHSADGPYAPEPSFAGAAMEAPMSNVVGFQPFSEDGSLEDVLNEKAETFQQMLFRLIDRRGLTDPEVYKKANLDRKLFSKIRSNENYAPSKKTALALAIALELNLDETMDLLRRAGLALSPSSRFDRIVGYCIVHGIYNIFDINTYLFDYNEQLLV